MDLFDTLPVWAVAAAVFSLRIVDVSLGTFRTISVVHGRISLSVAIGFVEILVWVTAVSQVLLHVRDHPLVILAYAGGFATGNAVGITVERRIRLGSGVVRMIVSREPATVAERLRALGLAVTTFAGEGEGGLRTLLFVACPRRDVDRVIRVAAQVDPQLFYTVDWFSLTGQGPPLPHPTGWRAVFKKK